MMGEKDYETDFEALPVSEAEAAANRRELKIDHSVLMRSHLRGLTVDQSAIEPKTEEVQLRLIGDINGGIISEQSSVTLRLFDDLKLKAESDGTVSTGLIANPPNDSDESLGIKKGS